MADKFKATRAVDVVNRLNRGEFVKDIAAHYGVSRTCIAQIYPKVVKRIQSGDPVGAWLETELCRDEKAVFFADVDAMDGQAWRWRCYLSNHRQRKFKRWLEQLG